MKSYKQLKAAQKAYELVILTYRLSEKFPNSEQFGLTSQLRRAAVSVLANLVEGQARNSKKEFAQFIAISRGSLAEVEVYFELALDLDYLNPKEYESLEILRSNVGSLTFGLANSLKPK
ncbi:MAG: hypothetical protein XU08_C0005G0021 [candidate division WWE3 bacterium CSP1-7]|uniref:S23 ribosomal protein n=1 Tax=candidate division WWE3 bacterium CSP1-7 TaxID=1576480 RepID=A0A0T5ZWT6_UNCKA|nr:MAG: hypothetical protein XU08_C0005G0021 [candidate division WWE3 bacterium CSP1-7]